MGNFRSEEGYINLEGVDLVGAGGDEGDRVPAFYEGDASQVYGYSWRGLLEAALLAGGGGHLHPLRSRAHLGGGRSPATPTDRAPRPAHLAMTPLPG